MVRPASADCIATPGGGEYSHAARWGRTSDRTFAIRPRRAGIRYLVGSETQSAVSQPIRIVCLPRFTEGFQRLQPGRLSLAPSKPLERTEQAMKRAVEESSRSCCARLQRSSQTAVPPRAMMPTMVTRPDMPAEKAPHPAASSPMLRLPDMGDDRQAGPDQSVRTGVLFQRDRSAYGVDFFAPPPMLMTA